MHTSLGTKSLSPLSKTSREADLENVVFALTPGSKERFYPFFEPTSFPVKNYHWLDLRSMRNDAWEKHLFNLKPTVLVTGWGTPTIPERFVRSADLPLRYLCHIKGTVREVVPRSLIERGVMVSNWGASISYTVAEQALLLVLASLRRLPLWNSALNHWSAKANPHPRELLRANSLRGRRVGLHGFGSVARELIELLRPFQVDLAAYSSGVPHAVFEKHGVHCCHSLKELFSKSDVIIECEALTSESKLSVNEEILRCLPEEAVFVNVGRGDVVDEEALIRVASERRLRLGLDVYSQEPLPAGSGFFQVPHATLSPHIAGPTEDGYRILWDFALQNIRNYLAGSQIDALITLDVYDRST